MAEEKETTGRQLKIRGMNGEEVEGSGEVKKERNEDGSKVWVLVVLVVSVLISLFFSLKAGEASWWDRVVGWDEGNEQNRTVEPEGAGKRGGGWFGPAVYELE